MTDNLLALACPVCDALYVEHDLEGLAACMEQVRDDRPVERVVTGRFL